MTGALRVVAFLSVLAVCFTAGFSWRNLRSGELPLPSTFKALVTGQSAPSEATADQVFLQAFSHVQADYYRPVVSKDLQYAGIEGMMNSLGDPHTIFLPPVEAKAFDMDTHGNFVGVGARLDPRPDPLGTKMVRVFDSGPAYKAGLRPGDIVTAVDGKSIVGMATDEVAGKIRGKEGTKVVLTMVTPPSTKHRTVTIVRASLVTPTVDDDYFKDSHVGYLSIAQFSETTTEQFDRKLDEVEQHDLKGLIIDLRGNPGGLLETAVDMLSRFVDHKVVVKMKMRDQHEEVAWTQSGLKREFNFPIVLLINEDSASAAEIFSGVLHDYGLVTLVGEHSYGKASVQNVFPLRDGSSAKITIARYYLPGGEDIGRKVDEDGRYLSGGLEPDVKADLDPDDSSISLGDIATDTQLQKAVQVVLSKQ